MLSGLQPAGWDGSSFHPGSQGPKHANSVLMVYSSWKLPSSLRTAQPKFSTYSFLPSPDDVLVTHQRPLPPALEAQ